MDFKKLPPIDRTGGAAASGGGAGDGEEAVPPPPPEVFRSCEVPVSQAERAFSSHPERVRSVWADYAGRVCLGCDPDACPALMVCPPGKEGVPEGWRLHTLDTMRYASFSFRKYSVKACPPCEEREELFRRAGRLIDRFGMVLQFLSSRYELYDGPAVALTTTVPIAEVARAISGERDADLVDLIKRHPSAGSAAAQAQNARAPLPPWLEARREDLEHLEAASRAEYERTREQGGTEVRKVLEALFQIRSELDPPVIALHNPFPAPVRGRGKNEKDGDAAARPDDVALIATRGPVVCAAPSTDPTRALPPGLLGVRMIEWPLYEHPSWTARPARRCQNRACESREVDVIEAGLPSGSSHVDHLAQTFFGSREDPERAREVRNRLHATWANDFEPRIDTEVKRVLEKGSTDSIPESVVARGEGAVREAVVAGFAAQLSEREVAIRAEVDKQRGCTLMRCGRCQGVRYCSRECQKADWGASHKSICPRLAVAAKMAK